MFNLFNKNSIPTGKCKLLKEKVLDVAKPEFISEQFLVRWIWSQDTVRISYFPEYRQVIIYNKDEQVELTKKETKWLVAQAEKVVSEIEERKAQDLIEKLRSL